MDSVIDSVTIDGCKNLNLSFSFLGTRPKISEIIVKAGTTLSAEYTLPTNVINGYTSSDWKKEIIGSGSSEITTAITTSHSVDTRYFRTIEQQVE